MAQSTIVIETDDEAADIIATNFGSVELRALASNAGVSRERGDTKRQTAEKIVAQDPALTARVIENDDEADMDAGPFAERRQAFADDVDVEEAMTRARHKKMTYKLKGLRRALAGVPHYDCEVSWEYGGDVRDSGYEPGLTSITISTDADMNWMLRERVHIILTAHGRCKMLDVGDSDYLEGRKPSSAWRLAMDRMERFYEPSDE